MLLSCFPELYFNVDSGYLEGLVRGFKAGVLSQADYVNLVQCESLEGGWRGGPALPAADSEAGLGDAPLRPWADAGQGSALAPARLLPRALGEPRRPRAPSPSCTATRAGSARMRGGKRRKPRPFLLRPCAPCVAVRWPVEKRALG